MTGDEHDLYRAFAAHAIGAVRESDYTRALRATADEIMNAVPAQGGPRRKTARAWTDARENAADLLIEWYDQGKDMPENRSADHVAAHRPGAVWARFLYWDHHAAIIAHGATPQDRTTIDRCQCTDQDCTCHGECTRVATTTRASRTSDGTPDTIHVCARCATSAQETDHA